MKLTVQNTYIMQALGVVLMVVGLFVIYRNADDWFGILGGVIAGTAGMELFIGHYNIRKLMREHK